jgi:hypothetical protein
MTRIIPAAKTSAAVPPAPSYTGVAVPPARAQPAQAIERAGSTPPGLLLGELVACVGRIDRRAQGGYNPKCITTWL